MAAPGHLALDGQRRKLCNIMSWKRYIPDHAVTTIPALAFLFAIHFFLLRDDPVEPGIEATSSAPLFYDHWRAPLDSADLDIDLEVARLELDDAARDQLIRDLLHRERYADARTLLLEVAAEATLADDQQRLGDTLLLLGEVAIHQQELATAEIYLQEALYLAMAQDNVEGTARSYQLLGELNIHARELARRASVTYDQLWQSRNLIARGLYTGVRENLQAVVTENLSIRRFGAAADAWEALASLHDRLYDGYQAQQARIEAARLYAAIGQHAQVQRLLEGLDRSLISDSDRSLLEAEIDTLFEQHRQDLIRTSQARDYQMLYHHYLRIGQVERAWQFRIESSKTLASTSDRALFRRQADIIAVLYNSNFAMDRAREYLDRAGHIYQDQGLQDMLEETRDLQTRIY